jgi:signal transduction histidine kinase
MAVLILICVAIVFILGGLGLYTTSQNLRSSVFSADAHDSDLIADYVQVYLGSVETPVEMVSEDSGTVSAIRERNLTHVKEVFRELVSATPQEDIAFMVDRDGRLLYSTCSTATPPMGPEIDEILKESSNRSYVTDIFYSGEFRGYVFAVVSPIRYEDRIIGYVYDEIDPSGLQAFMVREKHFPVYHFILVDRHGRIIVHDDRSIMDGHSNLSTYLPVIKALSGEAGVMDDPGIFDCKPCISAYHPVKDIGWGLVVATKADVPYGQLEGYLLRIMSVCLLFVLALTVFGYFASRYLIDPVERLSATMGRVSGGDYDVSLKAVRDDEIGDLERAFNSLVSGIKERDGSIRNERDRSGFYLDLISHDINNLNHAGMGYLEMAIGDLKGTIGKDDLALLDKAYDSLKNSSGLIDNLRRIQRAHTGRSAPEVVDMGQMLSEAEKMYAHFPGRDVTINYSPVAGCRVNACSLFREVLANIVGNAIKHSDPSRPLTINMGLIKVKIDGRDYCKVSIEDDGPGVPDAMKEAIFRRFQRGETAARGRGLGLYIVMMLVEEYGGSVYVEDRVPGDHARGARFVILMPAADN